MLQITICGKCGQEIPEGTEICVWCEPNLALPRTRHRPMYWTRIRMPIIDVAAFYCDARQHDRLLPDEE